MSLGRTFYLAQNRSYSGLISLPFFLRPCICGTEGKEEQRRISFDNESLGDFSGVRGIWCFAEVFRILLNWSSTVLQEDGNLNRAKDSSVSRVYEPQSSFLRSVKVRWGGFAKFILKEIPTNAVAQWYRYAVATGHCAGRSGFESRVEVMLAKNHSS